jgi:hypothetical protein
MPATVIPAARSPNVPGAQDRAGRVRVLFICGSVNQTRMMHAIARALPDWEAHYTTYYCDAPLEWLRRAGLLDFTILGWPWRKQAMRYLRQHGLPMDHEGRGHRYDLVVTCSDVIVPRNIRDKKVVVVQEGMTDPERFWYWARKVVPIVPRWAAGTAWTGASNLYHRFCVASPGYRDLFVRKGADPARIVVTGIPNFDDCARYRHNDFPHRDYVLCCTSDTARPTSPTTAGPSSGGRWRSPPGARCSSSCTPMRTGSAAGRRSPAGPRRRACSPPARPRRWWPTPAC